MNLRSLKLSLVLASTLAPLGCASTPTTTAPEARRLASRQSATTPYRNLKSRLEMHHGVTYLAFLLEEVKPELDKFEDVLKAEEKKFPRQYRKWQEDLLADGQGVAIRIDKKNYIFNVGYHDGTRPDDVKSGRSYGVGPTNKQSDPSDLAYLAELSDYLKGSKKQTRDFLEALLLALTNNDGSGWESLSTEGQIVATDFLAIYTAEADRHLMVACKSHPWEIDLAAATFAAVYVAEADRIMKEGELTSGKVTDFWAKGPQGSGIGETRRDRIALQKKIAAHLARNDRAKAAAKTIFGIIGTPRSGEVIQGVFEYLGGCRGPKKIAAGTRHELVEAFLDYMEAVQGEAGRVE
jgi:hypothetical protein